MSYIGNPIVSTDFPVDYFSGNGSTTAFTLSIAPASVNAVDVLVSGVSQSPQTYTISGTTLTFSAAPPSGTSNIVVKHRGIAGVPNVPSAASVTTTSIASNAVTPAKMANGGAEFGMRNRIINGGMIIDQRNSGSAVTSSDAYPVDRMRIQHSTDGAYSAQQNSSAPAGFTKSVKVTITSADTSLGSTQYLLFQQRIEGTNTADLAWGTSSAQTITISFWVRSSLTGTFGGALGNSGFNYSYPFTYTISAADTWEYKTITVAGPTAGTWVTDASDYGIVLRFGLGVGSSYSGTASSWQASGLMSATGATSVIGTNAATWYITGIQLEAGSVASPFENRFYGTELAMCQRYYEKCGTGANVVTIGTNSMGYGSTTSNWVFSTTAFLVQKRAAPTMTINGTGGGSNVVSVPWFGTDLAAGSGNLWTADVGGFNLWNGSGTNTSPGNYAVQYLWKASAEL